MITSVLLGETNNVLAVLTLVQPRDNAGEEIHGSSIILRPCVL